MQSSHCEIQCTALLVSHSLVVVVVEDEQWRVYLVGIDDGRHCPVLLLGIPQRGAHSALRVLVHEVARQSASVSDAQVACNHIGDRCAYLCTVEDVGLGDEVCGLESRPTVSLQTYLALMGYALVDKPVDSTYHCIVCALSRCADGEVYVGHKHDVAIAHGVGSVGHCTAQQWHDIMILLLCVCLIKLYYDRIGLLAVVALWQIEQAAVLLTFVILPFYYFDATPNVFLLLRIGIGHPLDIGKIGCTVAKVGKCADVLAYPQAILMVFGECLYVIHIVAMHKRAYIALHVYLAYRLAHVLMVHAKHINLLIGSEHFLVHIAIEYAV